MVGRHGPGRLAELRRLPAHGDERRSQGLGAVRLRQDARLPLGHIPQPGRGRPQGELRRAQGRTRMAGGAGRVPRQPAAADRDAGRHRARVGRAAAAPRPHCAVALRPAQPVPGQRRGRPPPLGDGLPAARLLRPRRPRGGRGAAGAPLRRRRQPAHPRRIQRAHARLAVVLHVHLFHRPRRQVPALLARRVRLRPARAHLPLHADRGGAPHVRRRERRRACHPARPARR